MFPRLRRTAFLLCGDWHTAEDLAQTALAKMFVAWREIRRQDGVHAYANRTLVNTYLAQRRLKRTGELLTAWFPDRAAPAPALETRMVVLDALATLPPRARAVVVLRYWADLSVEQVADVLGCSTGNVKSLSARALHRLRVVLGEAMAESSPPAAAGRKNAVTGAPAMDETTLRRLLDSALLTGRLPDRPVPALIAQTATCWMRWPGFRPGRGAVLVLRYRAGLSVEQVAASWAVPPAT